MNNKVAIILGSETDRSTMEAGNKYYEYFGLDYEIFVISAHRNPAASLKTMRPKKSRFSSKNVSMAVKFRTTRSLSTAPKSGMTDPVISSFGEGFQETSTPIWASVSSRATSAVVDT